MPTRHKCVLCQERPVCPECADKRGHDDLNKIICIECDNNVAKKRSGKKSIVPIQSLRFIFVCSHKLYLGIVFRCKYPDCPYVHNEIETLCYGDHCTYSRYHYQCVVNYLLSHGVNPPKDRRDFKCYSCIHSYIALISNRPMSSVTSNVNGMQTENEKPNQSASSEEC